MVYPVQPRLNTRTTAVDDAPVELEAYTPEVNGSTQSKSFAESIWLE